MAQQWGRNERVVWPPHAPVYSYGAVFGAFICTCVCVWLSFLAESPLQQFYTPMYFRSAVGGPFRKQDSFRLLYVGDGKRPGQLAREADVMAGTTTTPEGESLAVALSENAFKRGLVALYRGPEQRYRDAPLHSFLANAIYAGQSLPGLYEVPLAWGAVFLVAFLGAAIPFDIRRRKELKYGRLLKGPVMRSPRQFNKAVNGTGIGLLTDDGGTVLRIPRASEAQHIEIIGDTGSGKSTLIMRMLQQIKERGDAAIIYDPACEFVQRFYDPSRDIILNPLDARCPYWGPSEELRRKAEAKAIAASLYQPTSDKKGEFFVETPQKIFAHLLTFGPTPQQLVEWMSTPEEIDKLVEGTELASILAPGAQQQQAGVLASLGLIADSLRLLPGKKQASKQWSATEWAKTRDGWIFITSKPAEREALRPLQSLWIDLLVLRLLNTPEPDQKPVWFVLDELASLQRLPQLHTAITENRKSRNPLILGFQGKAQLEVIYGHLAEVMLSQPATKVFLKTTEPKAAEWVSKAIGDIEIERVKETHSQGRREGKSFTVDRQTEPLVMDSEISGLADKHAFLKLGNDVVRFSFPYCDIESVAEGFMPRTVADDELSFDPLTLTPRGPRQGPRHAELAAHVLLLTDPDEVTSSPNGSDSNGTSRKEPRGEVSMPQSVAVTSNSTTGGAADGETEGSFAEPDKVAVELPPAPLFESPSPVTGAEL